jgi:hypothetical protein
MLVVALVVVTPITAHAAGRRVRPLASAPWAIAVQGNDNNLWTVSTGGGVKRLGLAMRPGTTPSITTLNGGYGVAYAGSDSSLHTYDARSNTSASLHLGMMPGTSPSYTRLVGTDSAAIAIQANTGVLWRWTTPNVAQNLHIALKPGTTPSIAGLAAGGYEIAYQGADGSVHVYSSITNVASSLHLGMNASTSPAIAALRSGGFAVAIESVNNNLWTWTSGVGAQDLSTALRAATRPSIAATTTEYDVAAVGSSGSLLIVTTSGSRNTHITPYTASSPAIAALGNGKFEIAYDAQGGVLHTYDDTNGSIDRHLGMNAGSAPSVAG